MLRKPWLCFMKHKGQALISGQWEGDPVLHRQLRAPPGNVGSGCARLRQGQQWCNNFQHPVGVPRRQQGPSAMRPTCLPIGLGGRDNCHSQRGQRSAFCWCLPALPTPFAISTAGCSTLSYTCSSVPTGCTHSSPFPTLLSPQHFCTFTGVSPPSLAVL